MRGDLDGDGGTTVNDAALLTAALETAEGTASSPGSALSEPARSAADLTGDGKIDRLDLAALRSLILAE